MEMSLNRRLARGVGAMAAVTVLCLHQRPLAADPQVAGGDGDHAARTQANAMFGDGGTSDFYRADAAPGAPGALIRSENLTGVTLPDGAGAAIRILYGSTDGVDDAGPVAISGQILLPKGSAPPGGWPIVAWEHGTTGIADVCAPSWRGYLKRDRAYLTRWLEEGFAVVATDYQGLGTPGPHPYLLYRPEGYSALDAIRAALKARGDVLRNEVLLVGQSQGSGAALGAAWLAPRYAPDVHVIGVVATGLVVQFAAGAGSEHPPVPVSYDDPAEMDAAFAILRVDGTDQSLHPTVDPESVMTPAGRQLSRLARSACLGDLFRNAKSAGVSGKDLFTDGLRQLEAGEKEASTIPDARIAVPVFAGTGLADFEASLPGQYNAVAAMCDSGVNVVWREYHGLTHNGAVNGSLPDSMPFVANLLKGVAPAGNCATISVPGPVEPPTQGVPFND